MRFLTMASALFLFLLLGCSPAEPEEKATRSAEQLIAQIADFYSNRDISGFTGCFTEDFVFHVHELDVAQGLDSLWYLSTELSSATEMFTLSDSVFLELIPQSVAPWNQDTSLVQIQCQFDLIVAIDQMSGYRASGDTWFIAEETSSEYYTVVEWFDLSSVKERTTWSWIKWVFFPGSIY